MTQSAARSPQRSTRRFCVQFHHFYWIVGSAGATFIRTGFPKPYCWAAFSWACRKPSANSSAESVPNSPCLRQRNRTVVAPDAISSSPPHSVHNISIWTVFPSFLIFIENLISHHVTFPCWLFHRSLPYVRLQNNSESARSLFCAWLLALHSQGTASLIND